jgi:hypothetical protein
LRFLLDTNVVSAVMAPSPPRSVLDWLNEQETITLHLSTVTIAEISYGLGILPDGKRRRSLKRRFERFVREGFEQRVLGFDLAAAHLYGEIMSHRRALGRPLSMADGQIAAIARSKDLAVATRNVTDFEECGVDILNPFA